MRENGKIDNLKLQYIIMQGETECFPIMEIEHEWELNMRNLEPLRVAASSFLGLPWSFQKFTHRISSAAAVLVCAGVLLTGCGAGPGSGSTAPPSQAVVIVTQPANQYVPLDRAANFTVSATGTAPLSYQWSKNGVEIAGATSSSYTTPDVSLTDSGAAFQVTVKNASSSATSGIATVTAGARAPKMGDLRLLLAQQVTASGLGQNGGETTEILTGNKDSINNAIGSPLGIGTSGMCVSGIEYDCSWPFSVSNLPSGVTGLSMFYQGDAYPSFDSDLQAVVAPNVVLTSLDFEPANKAYAMSWVETTGAGGFDFRREVVGPSQIQDAVEQDGGESRVVTAVSFDAAGQANLISYGWQGDTTTVYETQAIVSQPQNVAAAATTLANEGYIISAFGGDDTDGYVLIGTRVKGDTLPRLLSITTPTYSSTPPNPDSAYFTTVVHLFYNSDMVITEQ
jgi:hypothetical protein